MDSILDYLLEETEKRGKNPSVHQTSGADLGKSDGNGEHEETPGWVWLKIQGVPQHVSLDALTFSSITGFPDYMPYDDIGRSFTCVHPHCVARMGKDKIWIVLGVSGDGVRNARNHARKFHQWRPATHP